MAAPMLPRRQASGAIPIVLHAEITGLASRHEVTLVSIADPGAVEQGAVDELRRLGVRVYPVYPTETYGLSRWQRRWRLATKWLGGRYPWRTVWFWEPALQRTLDAVLANEVFDVVQVEDNAMGIYRFDSKGPKVLTEHEVRRPRPVAWQGGARGTRLQWLLGEIDWQRWPSYHARVWRRFDRIQVFSARDALAVQSMVPDVGARIRKNPFCLEIPSQPLSPLGDGHTILFVGNFYHPPNVDAALWLGREIMPLLRRQAKGVRLVLVGVDPPKDVRALAGEDILVPGHVPDLEPLLDQAAVVIAPMRVGGGQRTKVLHAMTMGKAVVTTERGADGLTVDGSPLPLAIAESSEGLAAATVGLLASEEARRELGVRARAYAAEHFSPSAYVRRLEEVYAEILPETAAGTGVR